METLQEAAAAAMGEVAAELSRGSRMPALAARELLHALDLNEEQMLLDAGVVAAVKRLAEHAQGEAGDEVKYKQATQQMLRRWNLFLLVHGLTEKDEPTLEMMDLFDAFMYQFRQRGSSAGKGGLGDSVAEMAQYILAQVRTMPRTAPAPRSMNRAPTDKPKAPD